MFIEFSKLPKYPLTPQQIFILAAIKNKAVEYLKQAATEDDFRLLEGLSLIKYVKPKNKQETALDTVRLSKKGEDILKDISTSGEATEDTQKIIEHLIKVYKNRTNGIIRNKQEGLRRCQWFSDQTGIYRNKLVLLINAFIEDSYTPDSGMTFDEFKKENPRAVLSNLMENLFWCPPNKFAVHYTLEYSPLEKYREDNYEYIQQIWIKNNLGDE